jgi:AMMECR1 domain-containing protein
MHLCSSKLIGSVMIYAVCSSVLRGNAVKNLTVTAILLTLQSPAMAIESASPHKEQNLTDIVKHTMVLYFHGGDSGAKAIRDYADNLQVRPQFNKPAGVFVTLSRKGKTRGCWGSISPQQGSVAKATVYATLGALSKEYRYKPIKPGEVKFLKPQVTVVRSVEPISSFRSINPFRDGVMVRSDGKSGVILPGEASDAYYEIVMAKLKAGIQPNDPCQLYKLKAEIYD